MARLLVYLLWHAGQLADFFVPLFGLGFEFLDAIDRPLQQTAAATSHAAGCQGDNPTRAESEP